MTSFLSLAALLGVLPPFGAMAQAAALDPCVTANPVVGSAQGTACGEAASDTTTAAAVSGDGKSASRIPADCTVCPLFTTCYPR